MMMNDDGQTNGKLSPEFVLAILEFNSTRFSSFGAVSEASILFLPTEQRKTIKHKLAKISEIFH